MRLWPLCLQCFLVVGSASATTLEFNNLGTFNTPSLEMGSVSITGSNEIAVQQAGGIGIVGGPSDFSISGSEFMLFMFDTGQAIDVSYNVNSAGQGGPYCCDGISGIAFVTGFGVSGSALGTVAVSGLGDHLVSQFFGDEVLSGFRISGDPSIDWSASRVMALTFTAVPEPSTALLMGIGLVGLGARRGMR